MTMLMMVSSVMALTRGSFRIMDSLMRMFMAYLSKPPVSCALLEMLSTHYTNSCAATTTPTALVPMRKLQYSSIDGISLRRRASCSCLVWLIKRINSPMKRCRCSGSLLVPQLENLALLHSHFTYQRYMPWPMARRSP